jgi:predicted RNA-binding Zn-ribbon protein involved in translation (DUF1610 family)
VEQALGIPASSSVRTAFDSATGVEVVAEESIRWRVYACPNCGARVVLRAGPERVYFAHATGAADQGCDLYVSSRVPYTGRRYYYEAPADSAGFLRSEHMAFGVGPQGPRLALCLPAVGPEDWTGDLRVETYRQSHTFRRQHLAREQRIVFPLIDGQWSVTPRGTVSDQYLARLNLGVQVLSTGQNLFDALEDLGRQIMPGQSVSAGDLLWWVSRDDVAVPADIAGLVSVERMSKTNGWAVSRIALSTTLDAGRDRDAVAAWLQRPIRPQLARVWIEEPWPWAHTAFGMPIFRVGDAGIRFRADRDVDITVRSVEGATEVLQEVAVSDVLWTHATEGDWELLVNGRVCDLFRIAGELAEVPRNFIARLDGEEIAGFAQIQSEILAATSSPRAARRLDLEWGEETVAGLLRLNGRSLGPKGDQSIEVVLRPGDALTFENFGDVVWPRFETEDPKVEKSKDDMRWRAKWLLSVAASPARPGPQRLLVATSWQRDPLFQRLARASWADNFTAQVRVVQKMLGESS